MLNSIMQSLFEAAIVTSNLQVAFHGSANYLRQVLQIANESGPSLIAAKEQRPLLAGGPLDWRSDGGARQFPQVRIPRPQPYVIGRRKDHKCRRQHVSRRIRQRHLDTREG